MHCLKSGDVYLINANLRFMRRIKLGVVICLLLTLPVVAQAAKKKSKVTVSPEELFQQATDAFYQYNPKLVAEIIEKLREVRNLSISDEVDLLEARTDRMESMMQRVDAIEVIDSLTVDRNDFFIHYRLSPAAGYILSPNDLEGEFGAVDPTTVYLSEDENVMLWGTVTGLAESHRLTDDTWEASEPLSDALNAGGTANFPFMMPDGITLYYATQCDDSLGGYDIYVSRRNGEEFPAPQNMGMPYNSPYDDFLLAIDEETGAGWWATDRNDPGGRVTIYIFVPSEIRQNVDIDNPNLSARARLSSIALTRTDNDYSDLLAKIEAIEPGAGVPDNTPDFEFVLPSGRVLTHWDEFRSSQARRLMENYLDLLSDRQADEENLARLRIAFGRGDRSVASEINRLEKKILTSDEQLKSMSNRIIKAETK